MNYVLTVAKGFLAAYGDKHEVHFAVDQGEWSLESTLAIPEGLLLLKLHFNRLRWTRFYNRNSIAKHLSILTSTFSPPTEYSDKIHKWIPHPALKTHVYQSPMEKEKKEDGNKHWLVELVGRLY